MGTGGLEIQSQTPAKIQSQTPGFLEGPIADS